MFDNWKCWLVPFGPTVMIHSGWFSMWSSWKTNHLHFTTAVCSVLCMISHVCHHFGSWLQKGRKWPNVILFSFHHEFIFVWQKWKFSFGAHKVWSVEMKRPFPPDWIHQKINNMKGRSAAWWDLFAPILRECLFRWLEFDNTTVKVAENHPRLQIKSTREEETNGCAAVLHKKCFPENKKSAA